MVVLEVEAASVTVMMKGSEARVVARFWRTVKAADQALTSSMAVASARSWLRIVRARIIRRLWVGGELLVVRVMMRAL